MTRFVEVAFVALAAALFLAMPCTAVTAQERGATLTGRVTDLATGQPLQGASVAVVGTTLGTQARADGAYRLVRVPVGSVDVRVSFLGYAPMRRTLSLQAGENTADFALTQVAIRLPDVVTTATGEQRKVEVGNSVPNVDAAKLVEERPIANIADLLNARVPGVQVVPGNTPGTGARVRLRGFNSLSLDNDPIYVIDGIRAESSVRSSSIGVGGSIPSRVNDLNPEEIESYEVVRGPSAATLYGTDAANGVIVIKTKRGRTGKAAWTFYVEQGGYVNTTDYPPAYTLRGRAASGGVPTSTTQRTCVLTQIAAGTCVADTLLTFGTFDDPETRPIQTSHRQQYGLQVNGGSETVRYFVSGEWEDETGLYKMPDFERARLQRNNVGILDEWDRPNAYNRASARANVDITLGSRADLLVSAGYTQSNQRLPQSENNVTGLMVNALGGIGSKFPLAAGQDTLFGYRGFTPGDIFQETVEQDISRFIGGTNVNFRPLDWLTARGNFGLDFTSRVDSDLCRLATCADFSTIRDGFRENNRTEFYQYTVDIGATASFQILPTVVSKTSVGAQYFRNLFQRNGAFGEILPPGGTTVTQGAIKDADESTQDTRTLGVFIEESIAWRDRLFVAGAVRFDDNSAFGADFGGVVYPKASVSWVVSEEPFFRMGNWVNQLRLRGAYGASGVRPGPTDALAFFETTVARLADEEIPGLAFDALGNPKLKPEKSTEFEVGIDGTFWDNRLNVDLTYYNKLSKDALISRVLPPSLGTGATTRFENLGAVRNSGFEALLSAQLIDRPVFGWDMSLSGSTNKNVLEKLGGVPPIITATTRQIEGYPLNGYWGRRIESFSDANADGIISLSEIVVSDSSVFIGYSAPRHEVTLSTGVDLFNKLLRVSALADYKGGHRLFNNTERFRCNSDLNCRALSDRSAPLWQQARVVALREHPSRTLTGFFEDADYIRFREVSVRVNAPQDWAGRLGVRGASLTLAARNLGTITDYTGLDPEAVYSQTDLPNAFYTISPPTLFTARVNISY
jgi:TonB-linked SusC/RagA family outer membrane protein